MLMVACKKEATRWQTDWLVPIVEDTLSLNHLYNDSTLSLNASQIEINLTRELLNLGLSDLIEIPDTTISQSFQSNFTISNVSPGFVFVNSLKTHQFDLLDIQLKKVRVKTGQIDLKVFNPLNTAVIYTIEFPSVSLNGQSFNQSFTVASGSVQNPTVSSQIIDLSGYDIALGGTQDMEFNKIQSKLTLQTDPNGPSVSIFNNQNFHFEASFENLTFDYAKGYFGSSTIFQSSQFNIPYLNKISDGSLSLPDMQLSFEVENGFKMGLRAQIEQLSTTNNQGQMVSLIAPSIGPSMFLAGASGSFNSLQPSHLDIEFNNNNSNIQDYIENLGALQQISYQLQPNPWGNVNAGHDEAFANSRLKVKVHAQMPLSLCADGLSLQDTFNINLSQDFNKTHISSGNIILEATNAFPLACDLILYFLKDGQIWHTLVADAQIASAALGQIDPIDGLLKKNSKINISLPDQIVADLKDLNQLIVRATLATTDPNTGLAIWQQVQANAFLALQMKLRLKTQMMP